jgi:hypothetical protein
MLWMDLNCSNTFWKLAAKIKYCDFLVSQVCRMMHQRFYTNGNQQSIKRRKVDQPLACMSPTNLQKLIVPSCSRQVYVVAISDISVGVDDLSSLICDYIDPVHAIRRGMDLALTLLEYDTQTTDFELKIGQLSHILHLIDSFMPTQTECQRFSPCPQFKLFDHFDLYRICELCHKKAVDLSYCLNCGFGRDNFKTRVVTVDKPNHTLQALRNQYDFWFKSGGVIRFLLDLYNIYLHAFWQKPRHYRYIDENPLIHALIFSPISHSRRGGHNSARTH